MFSSVFKEEQHAKCNNIFRSLHIVGLLVLGFLSLLLLIYFYNEGFDVFTAVTMKNAIFCDLGLVGLLAHFSLAPFFYPEDRRDTFLPKRRFMIKPYSAIYQKTAFYFYHVYSIPYGRKMHPIK
jgi:hypothetical protein